MDLIQVKELLISTAQKAGDFIFSEAQKFNSAAIEYKGVNNVVSYVDKQAEELIVRNLEEFSPEIQFITEEESRTSIDKTGYNWIIDPLDGTANFVHGVPHYSVSLALAKGKEVLVGVVYHIPLKSTYWAIKDGGAFKDGRKLSVTTLSALNQTLLATGFPYYKFEEMNKYIKILEFLMQNTHGLRRFGSAALDLAYVAEGLFDGFFEYNLNSWDMAAGVLLVQEAGGLVSDFKGSADYLFGGDVVAGGICQKSLLEVIKKHW